MDTYDETDFDSRMQRGAGRQDAQAKFWRFMRYLSSRQMECWGFFAAGYLIATIL